MRWKMIFRDIYLPLSLFNAIFILRTHMITWYESMESLKKDLDAELQDLSSLMGLRGMTFYEFGSLTPNLFKLAKKTM